MPKPVVIDQRKTRKRRSSAVEITPEPDEMQEKISPETEGGPAPPVERGQPDHSLVPTPKKKNLTPEDLFRYWQSVPQRERDAWFIGYMYRDLPDCDALQPLSMEELQEIQRKKRRAPETNCGKLVEPLDPENWLQLVKDKWGAGDYRLRLNDQHPSVRATVAECKIDAGRDWNSHPPVLKLEEVVLAEPRNEPYLRWARLRGLKFPGDPGSEPTISTEQEEDDMANVAAVEKLTDALVDATRNRPQPVTTVPADVGAVAKAVDSLTEGFSAAASRQQEIILNGVRAVQEMQTKSQDPTEFHRAVTEAAKAMQPAPSTGPSLTELLGLMTTIMAPMMESNKLMLEEVRSRAAAAERRAESLEQRLHQQTQPPPPPTVAPEVSNPVKNAIDLIKGLVSLKDQAGSLLGGDGVDADMPVWAKVASKVIDVAPGMLYNAAVMKSGQGVPVAPDLNPELIQAESQQPAQPPQVEAAEEQPMNQQRIAREIAGPLINALNEGRKGFEFAAGMILTPKIMGFPGRVVYEMAVSEGSDGMYALLQSYPELWQKLTLIPTQFSTFLAEFLNRKMAYQVAEASANPQPVVPTPQPQAVNPEVLPAEKPQRGGRAVIDPGTGKPLHTAPVVNVEPS